MNTNSILWNINLIGLMNSFVEIETLDGFICSGKITKINYRQFDLIGRIVSTPTTVELNNDAADYVDWSSIKSIRGV